MMGKFVEVSRTEIVTPQQGQTVMIDYFWLIGPGGGLLVWEEKTAYGKTLRYPQANTQEIFGQMMVKKKHGGAVGYTKIPLAYWYNALRFV